MSYKKSRFAYQWLFLGLALAAFGGLLTYETVKDRETITATAKQRLQDQLRGAELNLSAQLESADKAILSVIHDIPTWQQEGDLGHGALRRLNALTSAMSGIRTMAVLDASGKVIASTRTVLADRNLAEREYFRTPAHDGDLGKLYVSEPFRSISGTYVVTLTRIVPDENGKFGGIVFAALAPDYFATLLQSLLYTPDMHAEMAHGNGRSFVSVPAGDQDPPFEERPLLRPLPRDANVTFTLTQPDAHNAPRLTVIRAVQPNSLQMSAPLIISMSQDEGALYMRWEEHRLALAAVFLSVTLFAVISLAYLQRRERRHEETQLAAQQASAEANERLRLATQADELGIWEYDLRTGKLVWDDGMFRIYGIRREEFHSDYIDWLGRVVEEDREESNRAVMDATQRHQPFNARFRIQRGDGEVRVIRAVADTLFDLAGKPTKMVGINKDVTERHLAKAALEEAEEKFRTAFDEAPIGIALVDTQGRFLKVNRALTDMLGYSKDEFQQIDFQRVTHAEDLGNDLTALQELVEKKRTSFQTEKRYLHADGHVVWVLLSVSTIYDSAGRVDYFIAQIQDISQLKEQELKLAHMAHYDKLTGLPNRALLTDRMQHEIAVARRSSRRMAVCYFDLDGFKPINDTHGHSAGDRALMELACRIQGCLRAPDTVCRIGGDEFVILVPDIDTVDSVLPIVGRVRAAIEEPVEIRPGVPVRLSASFGISIYPSDAEDVETLLRCADQAMYASKRMPHKPYTFFSELQAQPAPIHLVQT